MEFARLLERRNHSLQFPFSRPQDGVADRPDEGSFSKLAQPSKAVLVVGKEPSPALLGTLSHCFATGEGENWRQPAWLQNFHMRLPCCKGGGESSAYTFGRPG